MYDVLITEIPGGNVEVDSGRVMMVILNPACWRAAVMGAPKLPEAWAVRVASRVDGEDLRRIWRLF